MTDETFMAKAVKAHTEHAEAEDLGDKVKEKSLEVRRGEEAKRAQKSGKYLYLVYTSYEYHSPQTNLENTPPAPRLKLLKLVRTPHPEIQNKRFTQDVVATPRGRLVSRGRVM